MPAWLESELPGLGMLVTVMREDVFEALAAVGAAESGRDVDGAGTGGRAAAEAELALAVGSAEAALVPNGDGETEAVGAARALEDDGAEDAGTPVAVGRNFLLERSTEPEDCQERLCDRAVPEADGSGLAGEAYF